MPAAALLLEALPMISKKIDSQEQKGRNMAMATIQMIQARKAAKKAQQLHPPTVDNQEAQYTAELDNIRKSRTPGLAYKESLRQLKVAQADAAKNIMSASGGASGAAIAGLTGLADATDNAYGKIFSQGEAQKNIENADYEVNLHRMIDRRGDLAMNDYSNALVNAKELKQSAGANMQAAINGGKTGEASDDSGDILNMLKKKKRVDAPNFNASTNYATSGASENPMVAAPTEEPFDINTILLK